ncbi:hypothetical protein F5B22DRAFT_644673 [Xylaria bambusicola]|uniref:uncharacterized protein n=1 Tax=Xylaria bambusicola TaxID=326684 RepID=UPI00200739C1|nr:uncharacterized protein F5B22DRAFT_644673 [Xylaria bambusicola]KAI0520933.1 hypothetical protein F5B22DRAFT_644673 [Xylaria bambusicola]
MADRGMKKWTEDELKQFKQEVIGQLISTGGKVDLKLFNFPDRTPKALSHLWTKMKAECAEYVASLADKKANPDAIKTPTAEKGVTTPGSCKRTAQAAGLADGDGSPRTPTPTKRSRKSSQPRNKYAAQAQISSVDKDETEEANTKGGKQEEPISEFGELPISDDSIIQ